MDEESKNDNVLVLKDQNNQENVDISSGNDADSNSNSPTTKCKSETPQPASACTSRTASASSEENKTEKLLKILQFRNPGPQLASFNPDKSRREQRKVKQFLSSTLNQTITSPEKLGSSSTIPEKKPKMISKRRNYHDRYGVRLVDNKDVCDCQHLNCPGCHFPCNSCGSEKCGVECRCSRRWTYESVVDIENPYAPKQKIESY